MAGPGGGRDPWARTDLLTSSQFFPALGAGEESPDNLWADLLKGDHPHWRERCVLGQLSF